MTDIIVDTKLQYRHPNLATALAAFQAELPPLTKDERAKVQGTTKDGRSYDKSYDYSGLDQFVEIVEPVLGKNGLSITSKTTFRDGEFILLVSLLHESGERETAEWLLPDPRRNGPQEIGSSTTYGRRYLGWGLAGVFPGGADDDGAQAQKSHRESWDDAKPVRPVSAPPAPVEKRVFTDADVFGYQAKMSASVLPLAITGYDWMAGQDIHNRAVVNPADPTAQVPITATQMLAGRIADEAMQSDMTPGDIGKLREVAIDRGLQKVKVSETETLEQVLHEAHELAVHAEVEAAKASTPDPATA